MKSDRTDQLCPLCWSLRGMSSRSPICSACTWYTLYCSASLSSMNSPATLCSLSTRPVFNITLRLSSPSSETNAALFHSSICMGPAQSINEEVQSKVYKWRSAVQGVQVHCQPNVVPTWRSWWEMKWSERMSFVSFLSFGSYPLHQYMLFLVRQQNLWWIKGLYVRMHPCIWRPPFHNSPRLLHVCTREDHMCTNVEKWSI